MSYHYVKEGFSVCRIDRMEYRGTKNINTIIVSSMKVLYRYARIRGYYGLQYTIISADTIMSPTMYTKK